MNQPATKTPPTKLDQLAYDWSQAKREEKTAQTKRVEIENKIQKLMPELVEGTATEKQNYFSVSISYGLTRKIETDKLNELYKNKKLQPALGLAFVNKQTIDLSALRAIEKAQPKVYAQLATAISAKPCKPSISIKEL